jgi:hypothetical protein
MSASIDHVPAASTRREDITADVKSININYRRMLLVEKKYLPGRGICIKHLQGKLCEQLMACTELGVR